jgi:hypothetical protein
MMGEKGDGIARESVLLQVELMFYQNGEKGTKDRQDELTNPNSVIII